MSTDTAKKAGRKNDMVHVFAILIAVVVQIVWFLLTISKLREQYAWISIFISLAAVILVLVIYGKHLNAAIKMPWIMLILAFPLLGVFFYD